MLRPQDTDTRERKSLNGLWSFALDPQTAGRRDGWFARPLAGARKMAVPASFNDITADPAVRDYCGIPRGWDGQRITLYFESATHRATVWVDETEVISHEGGYTPFEADITDQVQAGEQARIGELLHRLPAHAGRVEDEAVVVVAEACRHRLHARRRHASG